MSDELEFDIDLGPVTVAVHTDHGNLIDYLRQFYPIIARPADSTPSWTFRVMLTDPEPGMTMTPWQVGFAADPHQRVLTIRSTRERDLAITARKAIREALLDYCEARRYTMVHASAVADDRRMIIVVGDKGSGKTTLALNGLLEMGYQYLSNDHLILYRHDDGQLMVTSLPTPIPIKVGTYLDYENELGQPWENEGVDIAAFRLMPQRQRYENDKQLCTRLLFTFGGLGQKNPVHTSLDNLEVVVVLARYASGDIAESPVPAPFPQESLWPHVRFDWVFDRAFNTRHLPRRERDPNRYALDSHDLLIDLATGARVVQWNHRGRLGPLISWLDAEVRP